MIEPINPSRVATTSVATPPAKTAHAAELATFYSSCDAAARLGIRRATLYSYVSRGLLKAHPTINARERRYRAGDVAQLAQQLSSRRNPHAVAKRSLDFGLPVVDSAIGLIARGRLYYRGADAVSLARTQSVEEVATWLWQAHAEIAFPDRDAWLATAGLQAARQSGVRAGTRRFDASIDSASSLLSAFAVSGTRVPMLTASEREQRPHLEYGRLVRVLAACLLRRRPSTAPLHQQCARAWRLDPHEASQVRTALVLCADHELNASTFTVRCVASTGASLSAALLAGLAALSGDRHGGVTERVESMLDALPSARARTMPYLRSAVSRGVLPGFGHPLYPEGDVRAAAILDGMSRRNAIWRRVSSQVEQLTGLQPSLDFALVALRRELGMPRGSAFGLFALGRSLGWIAHALEQRTSGQLIRPRASYSGPLPNPEQKTTERPQAFGSERNVAAGESTIPPT